MNEKRAAGRGQRLGSWGITTGTATGSLSHIKLHRVAHVEGSHWVLSGMNYAQNFTDESVRG